MPENTTLYKIMILYMLDKVDFPLSNTQITNFILDRDYTTYFTVQQTVSALLDAELIVAESTHNNTRYRITDDGAQTLKFYGDKISDGIRTDIHSYLTEQGAELKAEASVYADYYKASGTPGYGVRCQYNEKDRSVIDLTLYASTSEQAVAICQNWKKKYEDVYASLMDTLLV